jgi:DNA invertase Pin-like site-specific DNA recombinase
MDDYPEPASINLVTRVDRLERMVLSLTPTERKLEWLRSHGPIILAGMLMASTDMSWPDARSLAKHAIAQAEALYYAIEALA